MIHHQEHLFIIRKLEGANNFQHPHTQHPHPHAHFGGGQSAMPPVRMPMHYFFFLLSGTVLAEIGGKTYLIKEKELVIIPAGQVFLIKYFENSNGYMGGFHPRLFANENLLVKYDFLRVWGSPKIELDEVSFSRQLPIFNRMYEEFSAGCSDLEIIRAYLSVVLAEADAIYRTTVREVSLHNNSLCSRFLDLLFSGDAKSQVRTSSEYAAALNITPNHLNKIVKGATGKSPSVWIEEAILQRAKMLLSTTDLPLGEIAAMTGINDQSYFARKFKKHEGISPSEYRQKFK